jgi:hypothetical protein
MVVLAVGVKLGTPIRPHRREEVAQAWLLFVDSLQKLVRSEPNKDVAVHVPPCEALRERRYNSKRLVVDTSGQVELEGLRDDAYWPPDM